MFIYFVDIPDYERSDELCLVCSKADTNIEAKFSFTCDGEPFRLCGTSIFLFFVISCNWDICDHFPAHFIRLLSERSMLHMQVRKEQSNLNLKKCIIFFIELKH